LRTRRARKQCRPNLDRAFIPRQSMKFKAIYFGDSTKSMGGDGFAQ
jgi:hypothetical protein